MKIGLIEKNPVHIKTAYWFMGLGMSDGIDEIHANIPMSDAYGFFPLIHKNCKILTSGEGGIRTHVSFKRTNRFRGGAVIAPSVPLRICSLVGVTPRPNLSFN